MISKTKTYTIDRIADVYLARLLKLEKKKKQNEFLNIILDNENIYYDQEIINGAIEKLTAKGLIGQIFGVSKFGYGTKEPSKVKSKNVPLNEILTADFIKNLEGNVRLYELTNKGRNFVISDQFIDENGRKTRQEKRNKIICTTLKYIMGIIAAFATAWIIKQFA